MLHIHNKNKCKIVHGLVGAKTKSWKMKSKCEKDANYQKNTKSAINTKFKAMYMIITLRVSGSKIWIYLNSTYILLTCKKLNTGLEIFFCLVNSITLNVNFEIFWDLFLSE